MQALQRVSLTPMPLLHPLYGQPKGLSMSPGGSSLAPSPPCFGEGEPPRCALSEGDTGRDETCSCSMGLEEVRCQVVRT